LEARILALPCSEDWDGEGADAVTEASAHAAIQFLRQVQSELPELPTPVSVAPSVSGAVSLFWKTKSGKLLAEVSADSPEVRYQGSGADGQRISGVVAADQLLTLLQRLV
jgi:hypothetical protein